MATSDFTETGWCPSISMKRSNKWRVQVAQFGDGYQQRILDGINNLGTSWSVIFDNRPESEINSMINFLAGKKARSFEFYDRGLNATYSVFCDDWDISYTMVSTDPTTGLVKRRATLSATFALAFGITTGDPGSGIIVGGGGSTNFASPDNSGLIAPVMEDI